LQNIRLLYLGSLNPNSNSYRRYKVFKELSSVVALDTDPFIIKRFFAGVQHHYNVGPGIYSLNKKIRRLVKDTKFDIILIDNKSYVTATSLKYIKQISPNAKIVNLLTDDPFGKFTRSFGITKKTAPHFDIVFVQREVNINEFKKVGARRVELCYRSFDPNFNRPLSLDSNDEKLYRAEVGFAGTYEKERASFIAYLINHKVPVSVTGDGWPNEAYWDLIKPHYKGPSVYGDNYIKTINGFDIALHFLRHANRDEQDSRTFEIPACKVFMIAERSVAHEKLFLENEEAIFFTTKEELLASVKHYLTDRKERTRIATNGYRRAHNSGYDHKSRIVSVLQTIKDL
jgi:spore maturation protein CgeB